MEAGSQDAVFAIHDVGWSCSALHTSVLGHELQLIEDGSRQNKAYMKGISASANIPSIWTDVGRTVFAPVFGLNVGEGNNGIKKVLKHQTTASNISLTASV